MIEPAGSSANSHAPSPWTVRPAFARHTIDFLASLIFLYYLWTNYLGWVETGSFVFLPVVLRNLFLVALFLTRRPSRATSDRAVEWIVAVYGTFSGHLYATRGAEPMFEGAVPIAFGLMVVGGIASLISVLNLGRSFGIVPANRGVRTGGLYAVVRHPIYLSYVVYDLGVILRFATPRNAAVLAAFVLALYLRARFEERILRQDPEYVAYAARTRYMFLPGLL